MGYEYFDPNMSMFTALASSPRVRFGFVNEYSGLAVAPAHLYWLRRTQARMPQWLTYHCEGMI